MKKDKILIVESNQTFGQEMKAALAKEGYDPILVKGVEATRMIYDNLPRLIILDAVLADADSYEILATKHKEPLLKKIPVFLMSTQGVPIDMRRIPQESVAEFVVVFKADAADIVTKVKKFLGGSGNTGAGTASSAGATETGKSADAGTKGKPKLLWVEDDKLIGTILAKKLTSSGFDLMHAKNGEEALAFMDKAKPDAIVLDLMLPGMSGFDILQKIDMNPAMKGIPVMILSNLSKQSDMDKAKMLGAKKFLVKAATSLDQIAAEIREMCKNC